MTLDQAGIGALMIALLAAFAIDRFRIELVALTGLAVGVATGLVPLHGAFGGLANPAVITVVEILIIVQALVRSHLVDWVAERLVQRVSGGRGIVATVCVMGAALSVFMNNIGALALMLPLALALCRAAGARPGSVLLPLSFATLLGGTCSLIGTPANLIVSDVRAGAVGEPFSFFAIAAVGLPVAAAGVLWLIATAPRLLASAGLDAATPTISGPRRFVIELRVRPNSSLAGLTIAEAEERLAGFVHAHLRADRHVFGRRQSQRLLEADLILVETDIATAMELRRRYDADLAGDGERGGGDWIEAVVLPQSTILGSTVHSIESFRDQGVEIVALSPQTPRIEGRLADVRISMGDVILLHGDPAAIRRALDDTDCLAISPRGLVHPQPRAWATLAIFAVAVGFAAFGLLPPAVAFGAAVLVLALTGAIDLRAAIPNLNWPVLVMLAAMIPLGIAVEETGAADVVAHTLLALIGPSRPVAVAAVVLVAAILVTPFVNNVSSAVALAPIAVALARSGDIPVDLLLMLVAIGVSLDFLTPFGHHNNTLVMGIGDYRFRDFPRLGAPLLALTVTVALVAAAMISG